MCLEIFLIGNIQISKTLIIFKFILIKNKIPLAILGETEFEETESGISKKPEKEVFDCKLPDGFLN